MYFLIKKGIRSKNVLLLKVSWGKNYPDPKLPWCIFHVRFRYWAGASLVAQMVKNLPALWETHIWSLGQEDLLEKGMATHSSILAWRIPWTEEPGGLQSSKSQRVKEDWVTNTFTFLGTEYGVWLVPGASRLDVPKILCSFLISCWRRKWQPTPVFLPGEFHGQRSLVGCSPWGHKESDTTERWLSLTQLTHSSVIYLDFPPPKCRWDFPGGSSGE